MAPDNDSSIQEAQAGDHMLKEARATVRANLREIKQTNHVQTNHQGSGKLHSLTKNQEVEDAGFLLVNSLQKLQWQ